MKTSLLFVALAVLIAPLIVVGLEAWATHRKAALFAALALVTAPLVGAGLGFFVAESTCTDPEYEMLRCLDEDLAGIKIGGLVGVCGGIAVAALVLVDARRTKDVVKDEGAATR